MSLSRVRRLGVRYAKLKEVRAGVRAELDQAVIAARDEGETYADIAKAAGLAQMTVYNIVNGRNYK